MLTRLKKREDFLRARKGKRAHSSAYVMQGFRRPASEGAQLRIGYTVTKKIGNAVTRNRIKRRLREAVAHLDKSGAMPHALAGFDVVIIAKSQAEHLAFDALAALVLQSLKRLVANDPATGQNPAKTSRPRSHACPDRPEQGT